MLHKIIFGLFGLLLTVSLASAQEFPKPGPEHERLTKELVGNWDAVMEMNGQKSKCTATYKSICQGMWVASEFEGELGGMKFQGHGIDGFDLHKKKYVGVWFDSWTSSPMNMSGDYNPSTKLLVMTGESVGQDGKPQKFKNTTERKDNDHFTFKMFMVQADGTEQPAFTIEYTRRK